MPEACLEVFVKTKMHADIAMDVLLHLQSQLSSQAERKKSTKIYVIFLCNQ